MSIKHVVSVSGGKDSAATLLIALERCPREDVLPIFCDTGNEHQAVYEYLDYLEQALDITITRLKADFTDRIANKRMFIARDRRVGRVYKRVPKTDRFGNPVFERNKDGSYKLMPVYAMTLDDEGVSVPTDEILRYEPVQKMGWDAGSKKRWTNKAKRRALEALKPSGNPFLDLCMWKGLFPSRKAQFCTEELKRNMAVEFQIDLMDAGHKVVSWQGVRRDESLNRRNAKKMERVGPALWAFRPLVEWTALDVFDYCAKKGIQPNPLYKQGMNRVGCMPCINVGKDELREIASRFPEHIHRVSDWEKKVALASKRGLATFFAAPGLSNREAAKQTIEVVVQWSRTTRGGKQFDLLADLEEPTACASAYGLCE